MTEPTQAAKAAAREIEKYYDEITSCANWSTELTLGDRPDVIIQCLLDENDRHHAAVIAENERITKIANARICNGCLQEHPITSMCPPHEVRVRGREWFQDKLRERDAKIERLEQELAELSDPELRVVERPEYTEEGVPMLPIPEFCLKHHRGDSVKVRLEERDGFMVCPVCGGSYGAAEAANPDGGEGDA